VALLTTVAWARQHRGVLAFAATWCVLGILLLLPCSAAQSKPFRPNQVKAVFLFHFSQFVEWPPAAFDEAGSPVVIGILGDDPFGPVLEEVVEGEAVKGRPLVVGRFRRVEDIKTCHILFISASEAGEHEQIFATLAGRSILTVGDADRFAVRGGMVQLRTENNRIRLLINMDAAKASHLTISSQLLRAAEIVASARTRD